MGSALNDLIKLVLGQDGAIVVVTLDLVWVLWGLKAGWWVPGPQYTDLKYRYDRLQERFDRVVDVATEGTRLSTLMADKVIQQPAPTVRRSPSPPRKRRVP